MGEGPDAVPEIQPGVVRQAPEREIILRITSMLRAKLDQYQRAAKRGAVAPGDRFVVAMNTSACDRFVGGQPPYFLKAFLPIGHLALIIDTERMGVIGRELTFRNRIAKASGEPIDTDAFLRDEYSAVSAALNSHVDCTSEVHPADADFYLLHNARAAVPLNAETFAFVSQEWVHEDDESFWLASEPPETLRKRPAC